MTEFDDVRARFCPNVDVPSIVPDALEFVSEALFVPELLREIAPVKLFALPNVMTPAPALIVTAPADDACVIAPVWVTPTPVNESVPVPTDEVPMLKGTVVSLILTLFPPELVKETAPLKILALFNAIAPAFAVSVTAPPPTACVIAPVSLKPTPCSVNVPDPTLEAATLRAPKLLSETLFAPELLNVTAPVKLFDALASVIALAPAVKLLVPGTTSAPV